VEEIIIERFAFWPTQAVARVDQNLVELFFSLVLGWQVVEQATLVSRLVFDANGTSGDTALEDDENCLKVLVKLSDILIRQQAARRHCAKVKFERMESGQGDHRAPLLREGFFAIQVGAKPPGQPAENIH
jgi:hypothetical protein